MAALTSRRHAGPRSHEPRYTTIRDSTTGAVVLVQASEELLGNDPDEWPQEDLFDFDDDRLLYRQDDVHFG